MLPNIVEEEVTLDVMQRAWQRRIPGGGGGAATTSLFEDFIENEDPFVTLQQVSVVAKGRCVSPQPDLGCEPFEHDPYEQHTGADKTEETHKSSSSQLDASLLGNLPAKYTVYGLLRHEMPVAGVYVDPRICPGFKYRVRPLRDADETVAIPHLFGGRALILTDIGRGYARRFTFEADSKCLNNNGNYFYSDNRPEGFAFELELVSPGDKFSVFDANHEAQGTLEILHIEGAQVEMSSETDKGAVKKKAKIHFIGKVEFYETGVAKPMPMSGVIISTKKKGGTCAQVAKIINVTFRRHRYYLRPGVDTTHRRVTVRGGDINDIPTKYTMTGLEPYEIPIVGTYVDPRVVPGFFYRVRPNDRKDHLFEGRSLKLCSVGMGYAKRLTFEPDSLVDPDNYLWSDSHPDGLGLEARAVHTGMKFELMADDLYVGIATVFRADRPQREEKMEKITTESGKTAIIKYVHVDVTCHIKIAIIGGHSNDSEEHLMRVYGLAIVRKDAHCDVAKVVRVENVALDSQLNVLFMHTHSELSFRPL